MNEAQTRAKGIAPLSDELKGRASSARGLRR